MKFYLKVDANNVILDAITYPHEGYSKVEIPKTHLPAGINAGYYKWDGTSFTIDPALKTQSDKEAAGEVGEVKEQLNAVIGEIGSLGNRFMTADDKYNKLDKTAVSLDELKAAKIEQLKELCTKTVYGGFTSTVANANGIFYEFGFNSHDQSNFEKQTSRINLWLHQVSKATITQADFDAKFPLRWKTKNLGIVPLTFDEFVKVTDDAEAHLMTQQEKYWTKEVEVSAATTKDAVELVVW